MKRLYAVIAFSLLAGCAAAPSMQAARAEIEQTAPVCTGEADCAAKWDAAQLWIAHHAAYKIQVLTNVMIETYNPGDASPKIAVRVTKEPIGGGSYKLMANVWCNNIFGCIPDQWEAMRDFNREVGAAGAPAASAPVPAQASPYVSGPARSLYVTPNPR